MSGRCGMKQFRNMACAELLVPFILQWEGGFVNNPLDRGGATNRGITLATFRAFYGKDATVEQLKNITEEQWMHIFRTGYWERWQADRIASQSLANILVDWVWASGTRGITRSQKILGVEPDGIVGEKTLAALAAREPEGLFRRLHAARIAFVENIVRNDPSQKVFLQGWKNRINALVWRD